MSNETSLTSNQNDGQVPPGDGSAFSGDLTAAMIGAEVSAPRKPLPMQTIMIAAVLLTSAGALYGMRYMGLGPRASIAMDMAPIKLPESSMAAKANHKQVMEDLGASRIGQQVESENVKKNPFRLVGAAIAPINSPAGEDMSGKNAAELQRKEQERVLKAEADWNTAITGATSQLQLNAVMGGSKPIARINGTLFSVGDRVGKFFTLIEVHARSVELEIDGGRRLTLELDGNKR